jgi:hypothetical protein
VNLQKNFGKNFDFWWKKVEKIYIFILNIFLLVNIVFNTINFYGETTSILYGAMLPFARLGIFRD